MVECLAQLYMVSIASEVEEDRGTIWALSCVCLKSSQTS